MEKVKRCEGIVCRSDQCGYRDYVDQIGRIGINGRISAVDDTGDLPHIPSNCKEAREVLDRWGLGRKTSSGSDLFSSLTSDDDIPEYTGRLKRF